MLVGNGPIYFVIHGHDGDGALLQEEKKEGEEEEEVKVDTFKFIGVRRLKGECLVRAIKDILVSQSSSYKLIIKFTFLFSLSLT